MAIFGIVGQFYDENFNLVTIALGAKQIEGAHTGENLAGIVYDVIDCFGIHQQVRLGSAFLAAPIFSHATPRRSATP